MSDAGHVGREAGGLRVGLQLGLVSVAEVIHWTDVTIGAMDQPPSALLELALMSHAIRLDMLHRLSELSREVSDLEVLPGVLARGAARLRADPGLGPVVARGLYQLFVKADHEVPEALSAMGQFDDRYALAREGTYDTEAEVFRDLLAFARSFEPTRGDTR